MVTVHVTGVPFHVSLSELATTFNEVFDDDEIGTFSVKDVTMHGARVIALQFNCGFDAMAAQDKLDKFLLITNNKGIYNLRAKVDTNNDVTPSSLVPYKHASSPLESMEKQIEWLVKKNHVIELQRTVIKAQRKLHKEYRRYCKDENSDSSHDSDESVLHQSCEFPLRRIRHRSRSRSRIITSPSNANTLHRQSQHRKKSQTPKRRNSKTHKSSHQRRLSPSRHQRSPPRHKKSPGRYQASLPHHIRSHRMSPSRHRMSPSRRRRSPSRHKRSPSRHKRSPSRHKRSPTRHISSPSRHRISASRHRRSPSCHRCSLSRRQESQSLHQKSPPRLKGSQSRYVSSPSRHRISASRHRRSPSCHRWSQSRHVSSPSRHISSPSRHRISASRRRRSPSCHRWSQSRRQESQSPHQKSPPRLESSQSHGQDSPSSYHQGLPTRLEDSSPKSTCQRKHDESNSLPSVTNQSVLSPLLLAWINGADMPDLTHPKNLGKSNYVQNLNRTEKRVRMPPAANIADVSTNHDWEESTNGIGRTKVSEATLDIPSVDGQIWNELDDLLRTIKSEPPEPVPECIDLTSDDVVKPEIIDISQSFYV